MRRVLQHEAAVATRVGHSADGVVGSPIGGCMVGLATPLAESVRTLRNLHQYPVARHKSLVRDRRRYARNWYLQKGNNYELVETTAHERESLENFGEYKSDSNNDKYVLSTANLYNLPPYERLSALAAMMKDRWMVRDGNRGFDKATMMLQALECFSEMRQLGHFGGWAEIPQDDQDMFLQYVESACQFAQRCVHSHPDAVAIIIRAAEICDEMGCDDKRDETLAVAERCTHNLGSALASARESEPLRLQPDPSVIGEVHKAIKERNQLEEKITFPNKQWAPPPPKDFWRSHRGTRAVFHEMRDKRMLLQSSQTHQES